MPREQDQFLDVVDRDAAEARWWNVVGPEPLAGEVIALADALGRVPALDVASDVDVPGFDRSNLDGFAVRSDETFGASDLAPRVLLVEPEEIPTGHVPTVALRPGRCAVIATGGMLPRGADAVAMVEATRLLGDGRVEILRPVAPASGVTFAGTDIARGELVLRRGTRLTARETGVLAAIGCDRIVVHRRPRVAVISTGDELIAPGSPPRPAGVYDANATTIADALRELGAEPLPLGIVADDELALDSALDAALDSDLVLLSGGTSKGGGDLCYRVLARRNPGIIVHGVALKPGKPLCLGAVGRTPVAVLPGFPTSAVFTFHELIAPLVRRLCGLGRESRGSLSARLAGRVNSERGRTEAVLVNLVRGDDATIAYPMGKGSGSVTAFGRADGFVVIPRYQEFLDAGESVDVVPLGRATEPADLVIIGSHCVGLDVILDRVADAGYSIKTFWVGSQGGLAAASRGECDLAGVHLLDPTTNRYNAPFVPEGCRLVPGYLRMQGIVHRRDDRRFSGLDARSAIATALADPDCVMTNRNRGSGTRVVIDGLLGDARPPGHRVEARSHNAVAASVAQGRADWGLTIAPVAAMYELAFLPLREEHYDFVIPESRIGRTAVRAFLEALAHPECRRRLAERGFETEAGS